MKIIKVLSQHRFDYTAVLECEHCGAHQTDPSGYDDDNYHRNVMPRMACLSCSKDRSGNISDFKKGVRVKSIPTQGTRWVEV